MGAKGTGGKRVGMEIAGGAASVGELLAKLRLRYGSYEKVAWAAGVTSRVVQSWRAGKNAPSYRNYRKLLELVAGNDGSTENNS